MLPPQRQFHRITIILLSLFGMAKHRLPLSEITAALVSSCTVLSIAIWIPILVVVVYSFTSLGCTWPEINIRVYIYLGFPLLFTPANHTYIHRGKCVSFLYWNTTNCPRISLRRRFKESQIVICAKDSHSLVINSPCQLRRRCHAALLPLLWLPVFFSFSPAQSS